MREACRRLVRGGYAMEDGKIKPSEMWPASIVQQLVKEIRTKVGR